MAVSSAAIGRRYGSASGTVSLDDPAAFARRIALPVLVLSVTQIATMARITRTAVLEVLGEDYIRTARALGWSEARVLFRHALRNAALPIVTIVGLSFGSLLAGAVLTETVFSLPGMGTALVNAILARDYPVMQAFTVAIAVIFVFVNLIVDLLYAWIDPRIRLT